MDVPAIRCVPPGRSVAEPGMRAGMVPLTIQSKTSSGAPGGIESASELAKVFDVFDVFDTGRATTYRYRHEPTQ